MNKQEIFKWLIKYKITNYTIHDDLTVDVHENVFLSNKKLTVLPFQFNIVQGDFYCSNNKLTSLEHCPKEVKGKFNCYNNQLTSLEHCPKEIQGDFVCDEFLKTDIRYLRYSLAKQLQAL